MRVSKSLKFSHFLKRLRRLPVVRHLPLYILLPLATLVLVGTSTIATRGIISNNNSINLESGLVGRWDFNGDASDTSGSGNNGTVTGATLTQDRFGNANSAYSFDGNDYIVHPTNGISAETGSLSVWVNPTQQDGWGVWQTHNATGQNWLDWIAMFAYGSGAFYFRTGDGANCCTYSLTYNTASYVPVNDWSYLTFTWTNSSMTSYVNGVQVGTRSRVSQSVVDPYARIGQGHSLGMLGALDDMRIYNRALNTAEIAALYDNQGQPGEIQVSDLQKGLVGHWKLDGNAKDNTPYANDGTISGAITTPDRFGKVNSAYSFDGNDSIVITDMKNLPSDAVSVSTWVYIDTHKDFNRSVNNQWVGNGWLIYSRVNGLFSFGVAQGGAQYTASFANVSAGAWHHVVGTYDGSTVKIYVDGQPGSTYSLANAVLDNVGNIDFGGGLEGDLDDIRVYNRALSAVEISQLYDSYEPVVSVSSLSKGLVGHWNFEGNALDNTPYSNNGTVSGATLTTDRQNRSNSAYSFSGATQYITIPANHAPGAGAVSMWFKPSSTQPDINRYIFAHAQGQDNSRVYINISSDGTEVNGRLGDGTTIGTQTIAANQWHHVVLTWSGTESHMYVDGVEVTTNSIFNGLTSKGSTTAIGCFPGGTQCTNTAIDDVRTYDRSLSPAEVTRLYETY